jgi:hypothetical protein
MLRATTRRPGKTDFPFLNRNHPLREEIKKRKSSEIDFAPQHTSRIQCHRPILRSSGMK